MDIVKFKQSPVKFATELKTAIIEGNVKALEVKSIIDSLNDIMKDVEVKGQLDYEVDNYPEKEFTVNGIKYQKSSKSTYKYDHYERYKELKEEIKDIESKMKVKGEIYDDEGVLIPKAMVSKSEFIKRVK